MNHSLPLLVATILGAAPIASPAAPVPDADRSALADPQPDEEKAKAAAKAFVQEKKLAWGEPLRVERHEKDLWVIFPTTEKEQQLLSWRTIIVAPDGTARFLPRR